MKPTAITLALAGLLFFPSHPLTLADEIVPTVDQMEKAYPAISLSAYEVQSQREKEELKRRKLVEVSMVRATAAAQANLSQTLMEQKMEKAIAGQAIKEEVEKAKALGAAAAQARKDAQPNHVIQPGPGQQIIRLEEGIVSIVDVDESVIPYGDDGIEIRDYGDDGIQIYDYGDDGISFGDSEIS